MKISKTLVTTKLYALLLLIVTGIIINSCRKDSKNLSVPPLSPAVALAKAWYESTYKSTGSTNSKLVTDAIGAHPTFDFSQHVKPDWQHNSSYTRYSKNVIELPLEAGFKINTGIGTDPNGKPIYKQEYSRSSFLLLNDGKNYDAYVMTIIADSAYLKNDLSKLARNKYNKRDTDFGGVVLYYKPNGTYVSSWFYKHGRLIDISTLAASQPNVTKKTQGLQTNTVWIDETCVTITQTVNVYTNGQLTYSYGPYVVSNSCTYSIVDDGNNGSSGGASSGGTGGGAGGSTQTQTPCPPSTSSGNSLTNGHLVVDQVDPTVPSGGDGGFPPPTTNQSPCNVVTKVTQQSVINITNSVNNPCLRAIITQLTSDNTIQTDVTDILRNTFGVNDQVNITFGEAVLTGANSTTDANTSGSQLNNMDVVFNTPMITNATKEFLLETTMHEIFHAYLYVNPAISRGFSQHAYMIQNYVNAEVTTLRAVFPNLSVHDAECLVLAGYGDLDPTTLNTAIVLYNLTINDVIITNNLYKSGNKGTRC